MKRSNEHLLVKSADGLTRCPTCRRHVVAGATPRDRVCPFCAQPSAAPRFGARGSLLAASLVGLGGCGPSAAEQERVAAEAAAADRATELAAQRAAQQAAEAEQARLAAEAAAAEEAAAEEARLAAEAEATAAAEAAEAAAAAEEAAASSNRRRRGGRAEPTYTTMDGRHDNPLTYG
ncbi:MAG: hypothetical protein KC668_07045, partial [Myxococcales bacterium]|nr:hypothetical protein [Myxococcales bacterium]